MSVPLLPATPTVLAAHPARDRPTPGRQDLGLLAVCGLAILAWDWGGLDLSLARLAGGAAGFPDRDHWLFSTLLHAGGRQAAWVLSLALLLGAGWPRGSLRRLGRAARWQLALTPMLAALLVSSLKRASGASCPWDLAAFGGTAMPLTHWQAFLQGDGGPGHCFPAGHAVSGFGFIAGWFVWRDRDPRLARRWLAASLVAGLVFGLAQQWRGAHYMSHTLWTAWLCLALGSGIDALRRHLQGRPGGRWPPASPPRVPQAGGPR